MNDAMVDFDDRKVISEIVAFSLLVGENHRELDREDIKSFMDYTTNPTSTFPPVAVDMVRVTDISRLKNLNGKIVAMASITTDPNATGQDVIRSASHYRGYYREEVLEKNDAHNQYFAITAALMKPRLDRFSDIEEKFNTFNDSLGAALEEAAVVEKQSNAGGMVF